MRKEDGDKVGMLAVGDYFGERALLKNERRAATILCHSTQITLLVMSREKFNQISVCMIRSTFVHILSIV